MRAVLTYHSIDASGSAISLDPGTFRRHLDWLTSGPATVVPLSRLLELPEDADAVALTFDDGFRNFHRLAAPELTARELPATVFVVSSRVGGVNDWRNGGGAIPRLPLMGWDELGELAEAGFEIGAHSRTHPRLTVLGASRLEDEIEGSALEIRRELGDRPTVFAYPYGVFDEAVEAVASSAFSVVYTTELRLVDDAPAHRVPRLDMVYYRDPAKLEAWGTPGFVRRLRLRRLGRRLSGGLRAAGIA